MSILIGLTKLLCYSFDLVYWGLTPQQQPGSYQGGEMMMKSVLWWRKPEYPEETTDHLLYYDKWRNVNKMDAWKGRVRGGSV